MTSPVDDLAAACAAVQRVVSGVRAEQWDAPTPCTEWNVREVVNHVVMGSRLVASVLRGDVTEPPRNLDPTAEDALGTDPAESYRDASADLIAEFREPGALDRTIPIPAGTVPGVVAVQIRIVDDLVHGWDVARATGQPTGYPDEVVARALTFSEENLSGLGSEGGPFAPSRTIAGDAPPIDRLVALLGRDPAA